MNTPETLLKESPRTPPISLEKRELGLFNCSTINCPPDQIFAFCQDSSNVEKILMDLPKSIDNFLHLKLINTDRDASGSYEIKWENQADTKARGILTLTFKSAPMKRGTLITAEAVFDNFKIKDGEHSTLINIFLKRMKALLETGEIATTKGQPSGREEISNDQQTLH